MLYFSYNDFVDCTENGEIEGIKRVEEKIAKYEIRNGKKEKNINKNQIIEILRDKLQLKIFLNEFLNFYEIENIKNINYCNNIKAITDKETNNNLVFKMESKEIFIFIKVIDNIDTNITYKIFEHSLNIIKKWKEEGVENKRYPIVIPIVIYTGKKVWKNNNIRKYNKINYITCDSYRINFSYNMINIKDYRLDELKAMKSEIAKKLLDSKRFSNYHD